MIHPALKTDFDNPSVVLLGGWPLFILSFPDLQQPNHHWPLFLCGLVDLKVPSENWTEGRKWPLSDSFYKITVTTYASEYKRVELVQS